MASLTHPSLTHPRIDDIAVPRPQHDLAAAPQSGSSALRFRPDAAAWLAELERRPERCRRSAAPAGSALHTGGRESSVGAIATPAAGPGLRRVVVLCALMIALAVAWSMAGWLAGPGSGVDPVGAGITPEAQTVVVVQPGDTLWSIAEDIDSDGDVRATVDRLADRNGGAALTVGQRLVVAD